MRYCLIQLACRPPLLRAQLHETTSHVHDYGSHDPKRPTRQVHDRNPTCGKSAHENECTLHETRLALGEPLDTSVKSH